jgi:hypothetical protein
MDFRILKSVHQKINNLYWGAQYCRSFLSKNVGQIVKFGNIGSPFLYWAQLGAYIGNYPCCAFLDKRHVMKGAFVQKDAAGIIFDITRIFCQKMSDRLANSAILGWRYCLPCTVKVILYIYSARYVKSKNSSRQYSQNIIRIVSSSNC